VDAILHIDVTIHDVVLHWYRCTIGGTPCSSIVESSLEDCYAGYLHGLVCASNMTH
jgi:hypothetical protein